MELSLASEKGGSAFVSESCCRMGEVEGGKLGEEV